MNHLVSVIIPCYNAEQYVEEMLQSVLAQTYENLEIILINDGCTDQTVEALSKFVDPRLRIIHQKNKGTNAARNRGVVESHGDYLMFLDADDLLHKDKIAEQLMYVEDHGERAIYSGCWMRFRSTIHNASLKRNPLFKSFSDPIDFTCTMWQTQSMMQPGVWLIHKSLIEKAGKWSEDLWSDDDGDFIVKLLCHSQKVVYCEKSILYYRTGHQGQKSTGNSLQQLNSRYKAALLQTQTLLKHENSTRTRKAAAARWKHRAFELLLYSIPLGNKALRNCKQLGGSEISFQKTPTLNRVAQLIGIVYARRLQGLYYQLKKVFL